MKIEAFAKVNFTLEVFGVRTDGYHALRSLVVPISLSDTLEVSAADSLSSDTGYADDLCLKAARVLDPTRGARIKVEKRIPAGGGLGGGSADAAATMHVLNELWQLNRSREDLADVGAQIGSDVPALTLGGPVLMEGRGEKVAPFPFPAKPLNLVIVNPGIHVSTKDVFAIYRPRVADDSSILYNMRSALESGDLNRIAAAFVNDLQEPAIRLHPRIADAMTSLRVAGALGVTMSGSGSSVFGLVPDEATGRKIAATMNEKGLKAWAVHTIVR